MSVPPSATQVEAARGFRRYAQVAAWLILASGLIQWLGGRFELIGLGFVLVGAALLIELGSLRLPRALAAVMSALVLIGAAFALVVDLPQGVGPLTAVGFLLLAGIGLARVWKREPLAQILLDALAIVLLTVAMIGLAGFGFQLGRGEPVGTLPYPSMSAVTALRFLLAALAWMSARPERGMTRVATADSFGGALARRLLLPSLFLPLLITFLGQRAQQHWSLSPSLTTSLAAVFTGGAVASLVWAVASLVDRLESQRRETQRMRDSAATDGLTGLANRRAFDEALAALAHGRRERDTRFCLLMLDIDFFKAYNDSFGHLAGDDALRICARLLREALRPGDLPARYGGEEFAVLLPASEAAQGLQIAERIVQAFRDEAWSLRPVTISVGVAEARPGEAGSDLVARADAALYAAKHGGRDRAVLAEEAALNAVG